MVKERYFNMTILNSKEVAEMLDISVATVRNWTKAGKIPHFKMGGVIRYDYEKVMAAATNEGAKAQ